jgi:hypothetical protein
VLRAQAARLEGGARTFSEDRAEAVPAAFEARAARLDRVAEACA